LGLIQNKNSIVLRDFKMSYSILFPEDNAHNLEKKVTEPTYFHDLNLDLVFSPLIQNKQKYHLEEFYYTPLLNINTIFYRQEIFKDLEDEELQNMVLRFSFDFYSLKSEIEDLTNKIPLDNKDYLSRGHYLDCAKRYVDLIITLADEIQEKKILSTGLINFKDYINKYRKSDFFTNFEKQIQSLKEKFSTVKYSMLIKDESVRIRKYENEENYSNQILQTFSKFSNDNKNNKIELHATQLYNPQTETAILKLVASLYKDIFSELSHFCKNYKTFIDNTIMNFSREIQFYLSWIDVIQKCKTVGLPFCYPEITNKKDIIYNNENFNLALALKETSKVITNDFKLEKAERILVVTGPNQGGKTTFAKSFGQVHYLASLGLCVPGSAARLFSFDTIYTHFSVKEDITKLSGKLQDDIIRLKSITDSASSNSIVIINEIFASTTLNDAIVLGNKMLDNFNTIDCIVVFVTFLDEMASHGNETVSMMSTVNLEDPAIRTYKIIRKPPDGLAYAIHLAQKYGLTYTQLGCRWSK
jgi:DNA mismatch repair ATPase MutS